MATKELNVGNDFARTSLLEFVDPSTGAILPLQGGSISGFLATSADAASAADPSLSTSGVYIGGANGYEVGTWLFRLDASVLTLSLLNSLFSSTTPYFIVQGTSSVRVYEKLKYVSARKAVIV